MSIIKSIADLIEPDTETEDDKKFNLSSFKIGETRILNSESSEKLP